MSLLKEKKKQLIKGQKENLKEGKSLEKHTKRNLNTKHINYKFMYLLHDPFTFVNAYTKIIKNKGALTEGHEDEGEIELFGL